jgi:hypothetical protein
MDRQMERVNQTLETYLQTYINYNQYNWNSPLPLAELAYNNSVTQAIKLTLFYTNNLYHLKTIWTSNEETKNPASITYTYWIKATHYRTMLALEKTREKISKYYDQHHHVQLK